MEVRVLSPKVDTVLTADGQKTLTLGAGAASAVSTQAISGTPGGAASNLALNITAAATINENADPDVARDVIAFLSEHVPRHWRFRHVEGNSDAHVKASLVGPSVQIPVTGGRLALGTWQAVYFCEFDGPRARSVAVKCVEG